MLIIRTDKQRKSSENIHSHFTTEQKQTNKNWEMSARTPHTGTEQIVDFLYAILSFYSSEWQWQQENKNKQTNKKKQNLSENSQQKVKVIS